MNKKWTALLLTGVLTCSTVVPAVATDQTSASVYTPQLIAPSPSAAISDSQLYYGEMKEIMKDEHGVMVGLRLFSERSGEYIMHLSPKTVWVDSAAHAAFDPTDLKVGDRVYVYHSSMVTLSLPPQTAAFAVVRNVPMDARCGSYQEVEAVAEQDGVLSITSDNGALTMKVDQNTSIKAYDGGAASLTDIKAGSFVMAWYETDSQSTVHVDHLLLLPGEEVPATRAQLIAALHKSQGSPVVDYMMHFTDVKQSMPEAEAIRWAAAQQLMSGYDGLIFGPNDVVTLEQAVTVLWRLAHSPRLMDYTGLSQYDDAGDISDYASFAMMWAHQKGLLDRTEKHLEPQKTLTSIETNALIQAYSTL